MQAFSVMWSDRMFMPHGHCYLWLPSLLWLQVGTNLLIGISYLAISLTLVAFMRRVTELPFRFLYLAFGVFISACGLTHFMDVWVIWQPHYWLDGWLRAITAFASMGTAALLPRYVPQAVTLAEGFQKMRQQGVRLEAALSDLGSLYKRARQLDQLKTDFFANASHELRTPLTLILAPIANLVRREELALEVRCELESVLRNARLLSTLVDDLLDLQKLDAGKLGARFSTLDLSQLVREAAAQFESWARDRGVSFAVATPDALPAQADTEKLRRVLLNLLSNAFKYTPAGGVVQLELTTKPGLGLLRVSDSGPGFTEADCERLFERFSQGSADARGAAGTGIGLSIVRELVQLHHGHIQLERAALGGASFLVQLPLMAPPGTSVVAGDTASPPVSEPHAAPLGAPVRPAAQSGQEDTRATVLVVEDCQEMRQLIVRLLGERYRTLESTDGEQALERLREHVPDLIVCDLMMPKLDGERLLQAVRARSDLGHVPLLLLTANGDAELRVKLLRRGAQDYVLKPFEPAELLARAHNLVSMQRARRLLQRAVEGQQADIELLVHTVLRQKQQLEAALSSVSTARDDAETSSRHKSEFLSLVSHELRTPLASVRLQVERLARGLTGPLTAPQAELVSKLARSTGRLSELMDSLLQFNQIESGRLIPNATPLHLDAVADDVAEELRARAEAKKLSIRVEHHGEGLPVTSDLLLVRLILRNLCDNAIKYTNHGDVVVEVGHVADGRVRVLVRDTGLGIAPADRERVFQPFEQLDSVRHKHDLGVGLGLALVKRVADLLHAEIALESMEGAGSQFSVTFPPSI